MWLVIHDTLIIPQKKTAVLLFGKIAAFFLGDFFYSPFLRNINIRGDLIYFFFLAMTTAAPLRSARANAPPATPVDGFVFEAFDAAF